jgi:hypothetical protein
MVGDAPAPFRLDQRLLDWPDCRLELQCCKGTVLAPVRLLATQHGNVTFGHLLSRLRCGRCRRKPRAVYLCAGPRRAAARLGDRTGVARIVRAGEPARSTRSEPAPGKAEGIFGRGNDQV